MKQQIFIEAYGYHGETLFPYADSLGEENDHIMFNPNMPDADTIRSLDFTLHTFSLRTLIRLLASQQIHSIHINTISINLYGRSIPVWWKAIRILLIPYLGKMFGCKIYGLVHEADQYIDTPVKQNKRHAIYQKLYGWLHLKLFEKVYVLAPEVKNYLSPYTNKVEILSTQSLTKLAPKTSFKLNKGENQLAWLGPIDSTRRHWLSLLDLDSAILKKHDIVFDLVCDINKAEGPECIDKLEQNGLIDFFHTRDYRPSDEELFGAVKDASLILCLYATNSYGLTKTSGARHIALAFQKDIIIWNGVNFQLINALGKATHEADTINKLLTLAFSKPLQTE